MPPSETRRSDFISDEVKDRGESSISQLARALGVDYNALQERYVMDRTLIAPLKTATGPEPTNIQTLGRPGMERFVIAIKRAGGAWPEKYEARLVEARRKYDSGTHEMMQGNKDGWVIQYLFPRLVHARRRNYFATMLPVF